MKIKDGRITMLAASGSHGGKDAGVEIVLRDKTASCIIAKVYLTPEQFVSAMSRLGHVECDIEVFELDKIGKKHENKTFEFPIEIPENNKFDKNAIKQIAIEEAQKHIPDGWMADTGYSSQESFFDKGGKSYARTTIRRWVELEKEEE